MVGQRSFFWWSHNHLLGKYCGYYYNHRRISADLRYLCYSIFSLHVSYRKANTRLRKMGRPELDDVTSSRLKLRPDIDKEIEAIISGCGFQRLQLGPTSEEKGLGTKHVSTDAVTSWNRSLHLYERKVSAEFNR